MTIIAKSEIPWQPTATVESREGVFIVRYGDKSRSFMTYEEAMDTFQQCVMHALVNSDDVRESNAQFLTQH